MRQARRKAALAMMPFIAPGAWFTPPEFVVDPTLGEGGASNYLEERRIESGSPLSDKARNHELFHTIDHEFFDESIRSALARVLAPKRQYNGDWWGKTGTAAGAHAGLAERAADYYGAWATGFNPRPKQKGKWQTSNSSVSYGDIRPKRYEAFQQLMSDWMKKKNAVR